MERARNWVYKQLRKSEKYTKTDMVYLSKGGFWLGVGHIASVLIGIGLAIAFANLLPKESYGIYKFALSSAGLLAGFSLTGLPTAVIKSVAQGKEGVLRTSFALNLRWSFVVFLGGLGGAVYYYLNDNSTLALIFILIGSFSPLMASGGLYSAFLEGKKAFRKQMHFNLFRNAFPAASLALTLLVTHDPALIVLVYFLSNTFSALLLYKAVLHTYSPSAESDPQSLSYGKHLSLMNIIGNISYHIDKILIFHFLGAAPLAVYAFATMPVSQMEAPAKLLARLAFPKLSERDLVEVRQTLPKKVLLMLFSTLVMAGIYIILAPYIFNLLFPQYLEAVIYSQVLALTLIFTPSLMFTQVLIAHMKTRALYIARTAVPIINIILLVTLIPVFGIWGAIATLVLTHASHFAFGTYFFYRA